MLSNLQTIKQNNMVANSKAGLQTTMDALNKTTEEYGM